MAEVGFDVVEEILVRLDVKDLIRCKSVCKSWQTFISGPRFVKAHLKHSYTNDRDNHQLGHRRICMVFEDNFFYIRNIRGTNPWFLHEHDWVGLDHLLVVGSSNGLVCISLDNGEFLVTNPSIREQTKLSTPPYPPDTEIFLIRCELCWGFGYDSSIDDYKLIVGLSKKKRGIPFYVLTLKSNIWEFIGHVKYEYAEDQSGILCGGALHWFMYDDDDDERKVIISLDLSTHEFKEIAQPVDEEYESCDDAVDYTLGVIEERLCIFLDCYSFSSKKWVMKNNKWERYDNNDYYKKKHDVVHCITNNRLRRLTRMNVIRGIHCTYGVNDGERVPGVESDFRASIFVKSLVSPHLHVTNDETQKHQGKEEITEIEKRKRKIMKTAAVDSFNNEKQVEKE